MAGRTISIEELARRVERLCEFLLGQIPVGEKTGSADVKAIEDLKDDCADIQAGVIQITGIDNEIFFTGLHDHMQGS